MFDEVLDQSSFQVTVTTGEKTQIRLVALHREAINFTMIESRMTGRTESDEIVEGVLATFRKWNDVRDFDRRLAAGGYGATVARFH